MTIRIARNEAGNCINFFGSTAPAYWNACLSAQINNDDPNRVDIINDIRSQNEPETRYEFFAVEYQEFSDRDGNSFATAQDMVDYLNANANVLGVGSNGTSLIGVDVNFRLDATSTSIIMDNGSAFGVNTIKAVADTDGTIHIHAIGVGSPDENNDPNDRKHFEQLEHTRVSIDGVQVPGGLNDVVNSLNELFTVGPFKSVVITDPEATTVADVGGTPAGLTLLGDKIIDPLGDALAGSSGSTSGQAAVLSTESIDQAGEYFTFDIKGTGTIGFGLVHTQASYDDGKYQGNAAYADPANFGVVNSQHSGYQFSHWFHIGNNGPWTNYGANTGYVMGPAWYTGTWDAKDEFQAEQTIKMRVGLSNDGFIEILVPQDDGSWRLVARSSYPQLEGSSFRLGLKFSDTVGRLMSAPKVHKLPEVAPTLYYRYIESPDGVFRYPLFATAEEAEYVDSADSSSTVTFNDDPTYTTWYYPTNGYTTDGTSAPTDQAYTEITSLTNADLTPPAFTATDVVQEEGTPVNIQVTPQGATWSTQVNITPANSGMVFDGYSLVQGTLADVGSDTVYTLEVTRANSYGSTTGSMTVTATDVAPVPTSDTPWTKALDFSGSSERAQMVSTHSNALPIAMDTITTTVAAPAAGQTSNNIYSRPWATAIVFNSDGNSSNQHIWNQGGGSNDDNIYVRQSANGDMYFGWGRDGSLNECFIGNGFNSRNQPWHGLYIAHNGTRLSGNNANAANLAACFDIRFARFNYTTSQWEIITGGFGDGSGNRSTTNNWNMGTTGGRMDRNYGGAFTIGGRGSNRSYHGKVASMVVTTLRKGVAMPSTSEIEDMIVDPISWMNDTKAGSTYRRADGISESTFTINNVYSAYATQIWLMGDGSNDSYSNMIRNRVMPSDQNYTKLNLISMVSNDIQTVNINGLT